MILVIFGCGVAVATGCEGNDGVVATALAFGLVIVAMAYSIGNVSGCHINPAVSLAMLLNKKMSGKEFAGYVISQVLGAIAGAAIVGLLFGSFKNLGGNAVQAAVTAQYGDVASLAIGLIAEIVLTFGFVLAILGVTSKTDNKTVTGIVIGLTLTLVHLLGIRLTGTSVNPARSLGPALHCRPACGRSACGARLSLPRQGRKRLRTERMILPPYLEKASRTGRLHCF